MAVDQLQNALALVGYDSVELLSARITAVAEGQALVLQAGDCAEDPADSTLQAAAQKVGVVQALANTLERAAGQPVLRVGRIGGQFAKPRSADTEIHSNGAELPVYRGHIVNGPEPTVTARVHDPARLLSAYRAGAAVTHHLSRICPGPEEPLGSAYHLWTSHESLILDYELPQVRVTERGDHYLASTHWPWIGNRTNSADGAHAALLAGIANPVAAKIGPQVDVDSLLALCRVLDPTRQPGRLTLISRMGAEAIADHLPPLMAAVRAAGHPVLWLCDPMHGNTVKTAGGLKTRYLTAITAELSEFARVARRLGCVPGGLHLEVAATDVAECGAPGFVPSADKYTSLCDPRLNLEQAVEVVTEFAEAVA